MRAYPRLHSQVDAALRECSLVDAGLAAAVALPRDGSGAVLVGLVAPARAPGGVAPHAWDALSERVARCVAARHLPMHAVPARVLALPTPQCDDNSGPALPLNANGKVDRHALRLFAEAAVSSSAGARSARAGDEGPSTTQSFDRPYEATVRSVWRSLGLNPRSPSDGFACLGGDSLMAARAAKMLHHRATGVKFDESAPEDVRLFGMVRGAFAAEHVIAKSSLREYAAFVSSAQEREQTERQAAGGAGLAEAGGQSADGVEAAAALDIDIDAGSEATEADVLLADAAAACRLDALISLLHDGGASPDGPWRRVNKTRPHALEANTPADLHAPPPPPQSALHAAAAAGFNEGVVALLRAGATVQARSAAGTLPAHLAAASRAPGAVATLLALLEAGTAPRCTDNNKQTLLHWCARGGNVGTLNAVLATGQLAVDSYDRWHRTPLAWAVVNGHGDAARALLAAGASVRARAKTKRGNLSKSAHMPAEGPLAIALRLDDGSAERRALVEMLRAHANAQQ